MKTLINKLSAAIVLILFGSSASYADFPIEYQLRLETGSVYQLTMETTLSSNMIIDSQRQTMEQSKGSGLRHACSDPACGGNERASRSIHLFLQRDL